MVAARFCKVQPTGRVEQVQVHHRLDQLRITVALAAGCRADRIAVAIDDLQELFAHEGRVAVPE